MRFVSCLLLGLWACEGPPPTSDPDRVPRPMDSGVGTGDFDGNGGQDLDGEADDAALDAAPDGQQGPGPSPLIDMASAPPDADLDDGVGADGGPMVGPDANHPDAFTDPAPMDLGPMDVAVVDADRRPMDLAVDTPDVASIADTAGLAPDGAPLAADAAALPTGFVSGEARAMDDAAPVRARAGGLVAAVENGSYRLGPLAPGRYAVVIEADGHQSETVVVDVEADEEVQAGEEVVLFRGQRVARGEVDRFFFRGDGRWLLWVEGDQVYGVDTAAPRPARLVPAGFEVFFGFESDRDVFHLRRRTRRGVAGDIVEVPLDGGPIQTLFTEAQPWLGRVAGRYLAMVETRAAHSRLESTRPGAPPVALGDGVPWLAVTTLSDGELAWSSRLEAGYAVWTGSADGAVARRVEPRNIPATDDFLMRVWPSGLAWRGVDGALWRWSDDTDRLIDDIAPRPLPRFLSADEALAWRAGEAHHTVLHHIDGQTRELVSGVAAQPFVERRRRVYAHRVGEGLWVGSLDAEPAGVVVPGGLESLVVIDDGVLALVDGVVWRWSPAAGAVRLAGPGLSALSYAPAGATAWAAETGSLLFFPALGDPVLLIEGAPFRRQVRASGVALYVRGPQTYRYVSLPDGEVVAFDRVVDDLTVVDSERVLGLDVDRTLWSIHGLTGQSTGWARDVGVVAKSANGQWVAYTCERGIFVVSLSP